MEISSFKFSDPTLTKVNFEINNDFNPQSSTIDLSPKFHVKAINIEEDDKITNAIVELTVILGDKSNNVPFFIEVEMGAKFDWSECEFDKSTINDLLSCNAPALILGYIRPIISSITTSSPFPTYNIPFINFTNNK